MKPIILALILSLVSPIAHANVKRCYTAAEKAVFNTLKAELNKEYIDIKDVPLTNVFTVTYEDFDNITVLATLAGRGAIAYSVRTHRGDTRKNGSICVVDSVSPTEYTTTSLQELLRK